VVEVVQNVQVVVLQYIQVLPVDLAVEVVITLVLQVLEQAIRLLQLQHKERLEVILVVLHLELEWVVEEEVVNVQDCQVFLGFQLLQEEMVEMVWDYQMLLVRLEKIVEVIIFLVVVEEDNVNINQERLEM